MSSTLAPMTAPAFHRALIVANPIAGKGRGAASAAALQQALEARGLETSLHLTQGAGDAIAVSAAATRNALPQAAIGIALQAACDEARAFEPDVILSVGGDGTLREILDGMPTGALHVGLLPMGTANVLSLDFRLPKQPERVADLVVAGTTRQLDLASVTGTHPVTGLPHTQTSFLAVGLGIDAEIVRRVHAERSGSITKWSYVPQAARAIWAHRPLRLTVTSQGRLLQRADGSPIGQVGTLMLANIINFGGIVRLDPTTQSDDGEWEAYFWEKARIPHLITSFARGLSGRLPGGFCQSRRVRQVEVTSDEPIFYHVDGDPGGLTPMTFRVTDRRQRILAPELP